MALQRAFKILLIILSAWFMLTLFVQQDGPSISDQIGPATAPSRILVVYDPDPFYDLDRQVCEAFARGLAGNGFLIDVATVKALKKTNFDHYQIYVFCANTYNWAPDWSISRFIRRNRRIFMDKAAIAITLGSGSTSRSKRMLEDYINGTGAELIASRTYWLLRPNDESRMDESNVAVACDRVYDFAVQISENKIAGNLSQ
ncbi:MAG: hypothetical protein KDC80_26195 [Saprospiraceae bacterium]|nr:hypothetical protein [Saprospiraceae bacterium]